MQIACRPIGTVSHNFTKTDIRKSVSAAYVVLRGADSAGRRLVCSAAALGVLVVLFVVVVDFEVDAIGATLSSSDDVNSVRSESSSQDIVSL